MCYLNLTAWGIPATVIHGNALSLEVWEVYRNPFWTMAYSKDSPEAQQVRELPGVPTAAQQAVAVLEQGEALPKPDIGDAYQTSYSAIFTHRVKTLSYG